MKVIVDRIENDFLVVEMPDMSVCNIPRILLPQAKEKDVINIEILYNDEIETSEQIESLVDKLFK